MSGEEAALYGLGVLRGGLGILLIAVARDTWRSL